MLHENDFELFWCDMNNKMNGKVLECMEDKVDWVIAYLMEFRAAGFLGTATVSEDNKGTADNGMRSWLAPPMEDLKKNSDVSCAVSCQRTVGLWCWLRRNVWKSALIFCLLKLVMLCGLRCAAHFGFSNFLVEFDLQILVKEFIVIWLSPYKAWCWLRLKFFYRILALEECLTCPVLKIRLRALLVEKICLLCGSLLLFG